jgi:rubredoxin
MPTTERATQDTDATAGGRRECKICWQVYDPAEGDPDVWQIPPGTSFADLPAHWTCPNCAATKDQFLVLPDA